MASKSMQAQLEEEEMEKMRLGAALATLRADMESLSAAHASSAPGRTQTTARTQHVRTVGGMHTSILLVHACGICLPTKLFVLDL